MKKPSQSLLLMVFMISVPAMITAQDFDFRKTRWGMTIDQVRTSERAKMCEGQTVNPSKNDCICYNEELGQEAYQLRYCFLENKLESASYRRADAESNLSVYVDDFYALKTVLEEKYGHEYRTVKKEGAGWSDYTPLIDTEKDLNRLFKEGTFLVQVIWEKNGRTRIILNFETMNLAKGPSYNLSVDYGPVTKNLLYERNSFSEEDMEKL